MKTLKSGTTFNASDIVDEGGAPVWIAGCPLRINEFEATDQLQSIMDLKGRQESHRVAVGKCPRFNAADRPEFVGDCEGESRACSRNHVVGAYQKAGGQRIYTIMKKGFSA